MGCHVFFANGNAVLNVHESGVLNSAIADVFRIYREQLTGTALAVEKIQVPSVKLPVRQRQLESRIQAVDLLDISAVDQGNGQINVAIINRHKSEKVKLSIELAGYKLADSQVLYDDDVLAVNSLEEPNRVVFRDFELQENEGVVKLLPHSITVLQYRLG